MEWIVEAETLSDLIDHGRYSIASQPLIRCKDCKYYASVMARCEVRGKVLYLIRGMDDFCSRAERRTDETD